MWIKWISVLKWCEKCQWTENILAPRNSPETLSQLVFKAARFEFSRSNAPEKSDDICTPLNIPFQKNHPNHVRCLISQKYVIMLIVVPSKTTTFSCRMSKKKTTQQLSNSSGFCWNHPPPPIQPEHQQHHSLVKYRKLFGRFRQEESATNHCHLRRFYWFAMKMYPREVCLTSVLLRTVFVLPIRSLLGGKT